MAPPPIRNGPPRMKMNASGLSKGNQSTRAILPFPTTLLPPPFPTFPPFPLSTSLTLACYRYRYTAFPLKNAGFSMRSGARVPSLSLPFACRGSRSVERPVRRESRAGD